MAYFMTWDSSLETGIRIIDEQHKGIVQFINQLHDASLTEDRDKVSDVLNGLVSYTVSHFAFEEALIEEHNYHLIEAHKRVHEAFIKRIDKYKQEHEQGKNVARALSGELQIWLTNHIKNEDADYASSVDIKPPTGGVLSQMVSRFFH